MNGEKLSVPFIGQAFSKGAHLELKPLCVFESKTVPAGSKPFGSVDRCVAKAVFLCAKGDETLLHLGKDSRSGICPGGQTWTGLTEMVEVLKFFISTGSPNFRHGEAEYLKRDPEMVMRSKASVGKIRPPDNYLCVTPCQDYQGEMGVPRAILLFAEAEQLRNLLALHHFGTPDTFTSTSAPWGPSCASFLSYPAGLTSNCPAQTIIIGPVDPTGNHWLPPGLISLGIPIKHAERMVQDIPASFLSKRAQVAFPEGR
ncbi:MAG: DUF169 domain-containing protein [Methanomassiliicoccales archaeon]|nr:DUF169 domain-containing protein [Methanomassiliicoccales archaeon]